MDTITIKDLGVLCRIGVPDEERANPQRLLISVEMNGDFSNACQSDDIAHTVNYFDVAKTVSRICEADSFKLIERLAQVIADRILADFGSSQVTVEVKKFILSDARYVSARISRSA